MLFVRFIVSFKDREICLMMSLFYEKMLLRLCFVPVVHKEVTCQIVICFIKLILNCHFNDCRMSLFIINFAGYELALREA